MIDPNPIGRRNQPLKKGNQPAAAALVCDKL
jgi:hypothetical protein